MPEYYNTAANGCLDWDDVIEDDGSEFVTLEEGDYDFTVKGFERGRFPGSAKLPPCNKAIVTLEVKNKIGTALVYTDFILHHSFGKRISAFFRSIGLKKRGEGLKMPWDQIQGRRGRAHFKVRTYTGRDGKEHRANDVGHFYDWEGDPFSAEDTKFTELTEDDGMLPF